MERRQRLSRSRDFDAVYRQGRSVSSRTLTLHGFAREEDADGGARLGVAAEPADLLAYLDGRIARYKIPKSVVFADSLPRTASGKVVKRQLRETWSELVTEVPAGRDYVLVARPGLAEAAESRGHEWLVEQVREVIGKVPA